MSMAGQADAGNKSNAFRWTLGVGASAVLALSLVLLFLLTQATGNRELYERNYARLLVLNIVVAALLLGVIGWIVLRLYLRLRQGRFGSRLLVKLAAIFALVGLLPGLMVYGVSYQFVSRSIESWFDVKVEGALDAGLNLGRATLDAMALDLSNKTRQAAARISEASEGTAPLVLERLRDQLNASEVVLWTADGQVIASVGDSRFKINPERPAAQLFRNAKTQRVATLIEGLDEPSASQPAPLPTGRIQALGLVTSANVGLLAEARFLQVVQVIPPTVVANAISVQEANREYQERALARDGLRRMYIGTLTLSLFLAVFGAVLLAVLLGNQLAKPLLLLAEGVRQVALGDLTPKSALQGKDELGGLTRSFADMTQQLSDARAAVQLSMSQVDAARANVQTILDNLTAGVMVLDGSGRIVSSNPGATRILRLPMTQYHGKLLADVPGMAAFAKDVGSQFTDSLADSPDSPGANAYSALVSSATNGQPDSAAHTARGPVPWQQSFELLTAEPGSLDNAITLIARGAQMPGAKEFLLVFDDVSEMVSAQRARAWGEVARRLAHEIKNPLTPIQLSAERLEMKLSSKLLAPEQALLTKSVKTIVDQVDGMKRLVNEFRDYARLPAAELTPLDLNALIVDITQLYSAENSVVPLQTNLDPAAPQVNGDAQQLRQIIHNLVQNAQDALEGVAGGVVTIKTDYSKPASRVRLTVRDNGGGFPEHILKRAFEPYVTTKVKGTGLGLAVVKKIADEHSARIDISNRMIDGRVCGAQVSLSFAVVL